MKYISSEDSLFGRRNPVCKQESMSTLPQAHSVFDASQTADCSYTFRSWQTLLSKVSHFWYCGYELKRAGTIPCTLDFLPSLMQSYQSLSVFFLVGLVGLSYGIFQPKIVFKARFWRFSSLQIISWFRRQW